jgi:hypothetical protein
MTYHNFFDVADVDYYLELGIGSYAVDCTAVGEYGPSDHDRTFMI